MVIRHSLYSEPPSVVVDRSSCQGCGLCVKTCPADILSLEDGNVSAHVEAGLGCIACGHCMMVCPHGSIRVTGRGLSPDDLIELPAPERRASADALEALFHARRSVRRFTSEDVAPELLERIVRMGASAPMGIPPWDVGVVIVSGRDKVQELGAEIVKGYEGFLRIFRPWLLPLLRPFLGRATTEILEYLGSSEGVESTVGLAVANALANQLDSGQQEGDILELLPTAPEDRVGMVGFFGPLVAPLEERVRELTIFERNMARSDRVLPAEEAFEQLPQCDVRARHQWVLMVVKTDRAPWPRSDASLATKTKS